VSQTTCFTARGFIGKFIRWGSGLGETSVSPNPLKIIHRGTQQDLAAERGLNDLVDRLFTPSYSLKDGLGSLNLNAPGISLGED
jgi:hypothetical protein